MNILYLAHRIPYPPDKGDKIRSFHQLAHLAKSHKVWCACFVDAAADRRYVGRLAEHCEDVAALRLWPASAALRGLAGLVRGGTVTESSYSRSAMWSILHRWSERVRFDAVVAFSSSMAPYALRVRADRRVLDLCDLDSRKWLDYAGASRAPIGRLYRTEGNRLAVRERSWIDAFDATLLITEAEAAPLRRVADPRRIHVIGNGVLLPDPADRDDQVPDPSSQDRGHLSLALRARNGTEDARDAATPKARNPTVGFIGMMNYRPNEDAVSWFVSECWHDIRKAFPMAIFRIIGRFPTRRVRRLAAAPGVEVVGAVDDVTAELRGLDVSVAPLRIARGLQNKVLEAMAAWKPVVLTTGAAEGIGGRDGREFLIADEPVLITESVIGLLNDPAERRRIGSRARRFVAAHHRWDTILRHFELIVTGSVQRSASRRPATGPTRTAVAGEVVTGPRV